MKMNVGITCLLLLSLVASVTVAQKEKPTASNKVVIFAVLNDGKTLEPIGYVENKKLVTAIDGASDSPILKAFHGRYFKPATAYSLIFGGAKAGTVGVKSSNTETECARHTAQIIATSTRAKLKGYVMALAASPSLKASGSGVRRLPTAAERSEIDSLVKADLAARKISAASLKKLNYQNLTALDVDNDGSVEFVGTFWVAPTPKSRALLFFIAEKGTDEKYSFEFSDYQAIEEADTMSEDISAVDSGVYHELLLDILDYDGDGTSEILTYSPSFEGAGFNAYRRADGKWTRVFEEANYRCAY